MTIFELLELLEEKIAHLESRSGPSASSVASLVVPRGKARAPVDKQPKSVPIRKTRKTVPVPSELTAKQEPQSPVRAIGKRQALGKSLVQLRRLSLNRPEEASGEPASQD